MKYLSILFLAITIACNSEKSEDYLFLEGTWKVNDQNLYETWKKDNGLSGVGYKLIDGKQKTTETLSIKLVDGRLTYSATVPGQNNGTQINFTLNELVKDTLSFENLNHDFPQKIQYYQLSDTSLFVNVRGKEQSGFSYIMIRQ